MEIKGTNVNLNQKVKEDSQAGKKLAKEMMLFADDNISAVSKLGFQEKLDKMSKLSTQDLIKFIRNFDKDESVIELIVDEVGNSKEERKDACKKVLSALTNKAKELGVDTKGFEQQFIKELDHQFNSWGTVNTEKLDKIINAITQSIENRQNFTAEDVQTVQNTPAEVGQEQANSVIENRLEKAYSAFGERVGEDGEMTDVEKVLINKATGEKTEVKYKDGQMQRDGIAADIADGISRIWGSENTAAKVRKDLKATNAQLQQLKEAKAKGEDAYKAKFKEIFGIEYDYANIAAYQKSEQVYLEAAQFHEFEMMFKRDLKTLFLIIKTKTNEYEKHLVNNHLHQPAPVGQSSACTNARTSLSAKGWQFLVGLQWRSRERLSGRICQYALLSHGIHFRQFRLPRNFLSRCETSHGLPDQKAHRPLSRRQVQSGPVAR